MATTDVPQFDGPVVIDAERIRGIAQVWLASAMGDLDKTTDPEDGAYYQGQVDVLQSMLNVLVNGVRA